MGTYKIQSDSYNYDIGYINIHGEDIWLSATYTPIIDSEGNPYKVLNIAINITESKKQELSVHELLAEANEKAEELQVKEQEMHIREDEIMQQLEDAKNEIERLKKEKK